MRQTLAAVVRLRLPRGLVLVGAVLVIAAPAGFVIADADRCNTGKYRCNTQNQVKHGHTTEYGVYNTIGSNDQILHNRANQARQ